MNERWYNLTVQQTEEKLNTDVNTGLSPKELKTHQKRYGMNVIYPIQHHSFDECMKKVLSEPTLLLLIAVAFIAAILDRSIVAWVIISLAFVNVIVSVFTYTKAQQVFEDMSHLSLPTTKVMRNGKLYLIKSEQVVPGDIVYLSAGDVVPCDARLVESEKLQVLEVNLTGVVKPVEKDPLYLRYTHDIPPAQQANMLFASTIIVKGTAKAIACCTSEDTLVTKIKKNKSLSTQDNIKAISTIRKNSKYWSLSMILLIFFVVVLELVSGVSNRSFFDVFLTGLTLAVASIGEYHILSSYVIVANGLFGAVKQNREINSGTLIKNTSKIEDLKKITCLLVHKEGAFSLRDVGIEKVYVNNMLYSDGEVHFVENSRRLLRFSLISTGLYGAGKLIKNNLNNDNIYNAEENAIISMAQKCNVYNIDLDKRFPILEHVSKNETSKFETTLVNSKNGFTVACRGNLEAILSSCTSYCENGKIYTFDPDKKMDVISEATKLIRQSYRIIGIASKITHYNTLRRISACQMDMTFEGFIAIKETMLPGVAKNISECINAGIKVIMLCDDIGEHNRTLAEAVGIVKSKQEAITGKQLYYIKDELFRTNVSLYKLYEGLDINQKRKLLKYLHYDGEVVGVLARELDEIILLKEADVGFVQSTTLSGRLKKTGLDMAKNTSLPVYVKKSKDGKAIGSEALKFVSDVIISDADATGSGGFNAILGAVATARVIYQNLVRFVRYTFITQITRILIVLYSIFSGNTILTPIQILFSELVI
ncbi:MAG: cation-transporting P-type ATPase, partial [Clostridia bacterium]|nr:cation-transporting P-type ATPase [Clostridia bacterium]